MTPLPLYYSIIKLLLPFGHSEFLLRFPSVIFGTLTVAVIYCTTRKVAGPLAALLAGLILTLSFHNIEYSQEARTYALLGFCLSLSLLGLIDLGTRWKTTGENFSFPAFITGGAGLYALGLTAALYSHNTAVFFWVGIQFFFLAWWAGPFHWSRACLAGWVIEAHCWSRDQKIADNVFYPN